MGTQYSHLLTPAQNGMFKHKNVTFDQLKPFKMKNWKRIAALISCLCSIMSAQAQRFCPLTIQDGLSDGFIRDIECDSDGYMWFATLNGLNRYDGYSFRMYSLSALGHSADIFDHVTEDGGGHLWVKSPTEFFLLDKENDNLTKDVMPVIRSIGIESDSIQDVTVDSEKNLWVETDDALYIYYYAKKELAKVQVEGNCTDVATIQGTSYALLDSGGLWSVHPELKRMEVPASFRYSHIQGDRSGRLWLLGEAGGYYDTTTQSWTALGKDIIPQGDVSKCMTESGSSIWMGTDRNGIIVLDEHLHKVRTLEALKSQEFSLPSNHINCIFQKNGIIWVGTSQKGVAYSVVNELEIRRFRTDISEAVGTIAEDQAGNLYIGYDGKGLARMEGTSLRNILPGNYESIVGSYLDNDGKLYFATYGDGIFIWDGKDVRPVSEDPAFKEATESCRYITKDANGRLWIGTFGKGLICLDRDGSMKHYTHKNSGLQSSSISSMTAPGKDGTIYISNRHQLYYISPLTLDIVPIQTNLRQITQVFLDGRGILWVGTTEGLYYLDRQGNPIHFTTENGLPDNHIRGICEDHFGNLWVTSEEGFTNIFITEDPATGGIMVHCYPYFEEDGIGKGQFSRNAIYCSRSGDILMGNDGDIVVATPQAYAPKHYEAGITVTGLSVSSEPMLLSELDGDGVINIKYDDNLLIEFSTLDFRNRRARFETRMDGQGDWRPLQSNSLFLSSLSPGRHDVEIRTVNAGLNGVASTVQVYVKPPLYKSLAARCIYVLLLLASALYVVQILRNRVKRRKEKEKRRLEETKLQFFTNISHDLRTPLAMIIGPLENLMQKGESQPVSKELEQIDRNAKALLDEIDQILDFKDINGSSLSYRPTYGDLARFVAEASRAYTEIANPQDAELAVDTAAEPVLTDFDKDKIRRIVNNLLSNAFKYRKEGQTAMVRVSVAEEDGQAVIRVADNGPGISGKGKARIFDRFYREAHKGIPGSGIGLNIVQEFVSMHSGTITVSDNTPSGSIFTISIPIRSETKPQTPQVPRQSETAEKPSILNVEDNEEFRAFVTQKLSATYNVTEAGNGREALELMDGNRFDLVLSDVVMPEMDGHALCRAIRSDIRFSDTPVILLTAVHGKEAELENLKAGADDTLEKPFDIETLILRIDNVIKRKQSGSEGQDATTWTGSKEDKEFLDRIKEELEAHMKESDYSVEMLSSTLNISRSVLYKRLITLTGKAPIEYIRSVRLAKGREKIEHGETSIAQIAWSVGYSPKQFARNFKTEYGCLPSEYIHHLKG